MQKRLLSMQTPVLDPVSTQGISGYISTGVNEYILDNGDFLHFHGLMEIGVCTSGEGVCYVGGIEYAYREGSAQFILPFQPHYSISLGDRLSHWKWVFVDPRELEVSMHDGDPFDYIALLQSGIGLSGIFDGSRCPAVAKSIHAFIDELSSPAAPDKKEMSMLLMRQLLIILSRESQHIEKIRIPLHTLDESLNALLKRIDESVASGVQPSVSALAAESGYSVSRFRESFRRAVGLSPKGYILNIAVRHAQSLLVNTSLSVEDISKQVGFTDVSSLYRSFTALRGFTPLEYRKRWRGK